MPGRFGCVQISNLYRHRQTSCSGVGKGYSSQTVYIYCAVAPRLTSGTNVCTQACCAGVYVTYLVLVLIAAQGN